MSRFLKFASSKVNPRYILIDPFGQEEGVFNSKWKLRLNTQKMRFDLFVTNNINDKKKGDRVKSRSAKCAKIYHR
jgi:hypothetical protein